MMEVLAATHGVKAAPSEGLGRTIPGPARFARRAGAGEPGRTDRRRRSADEVQRVPTPGAFVSAADSRGETRVERGDWRGIRRMGSARGAA